MVNAGLSKKGIKNLFTTIILTVPIGVPSIYFSIKAIQNSDNLPITCIDAAEWLYKYAIISIVISVSIGIFNIFYFNGAGIIRLISNILVYLFCFSYGGVYGAIIVWNGNNRGKSPNDSRYDNENGCRYNTNGGRQVWILSSIIIIFALLMFSLTYSIIHDFIENRKTRSDVFGGETDKKGKPNTIPFNCF